MHSSWQICLAYISMIMDASKKAEGGLFGCSRHGSGHASRHRLPFLGVYPTNTKHAKHTSKVSYGLKEIIDSELCWLFWQDVCNWRTFQQIYSAFECFSLVLRCPTSFPLAAGGFPAGTLGSPIFRQTHTHTPHTHTHTHTQTHRLNW